MWAAHTLQHLSLLQRLPDTSQWTHCKTSRLLAGTAAVIAILCRPVSFTLLRVAPTLPRVATCRLMTRRA